MIVLSVNGLTKSFLSENILENVTFSISDRDKVGIVGDNGSGKTTLFNLLIKDLSADSGDINFAKNINLSILKQNISYTSDKSVYEECLEVFEKIILLEKEIRELEIEMGNKDLSEEEIRKLFDIYESKRHYFEENNGYSYNSKIRGVLFGLGFLEQDFSKSVNNLSGGQKSRLHLAKILLKPSNLILLDEPTNHLDIESIQFLESYLREYRGSCLIISHDRYFLNAVCNKIFSIENKKLKSFNCGYDEYISRREKDFEVNRHLYEKQQKEISRQKEIIQRFENYGNNRFIKQASSRRKLLDKMDLIENPEIYKNSMKLKLVPEVESGKDVLTISDLSMGFNDKILFDDINLNVYKGDKIGLVGKNGVGKTTLFKIICNNLEAIKGKCDLGARVSIGYYDQEQKTLSNQNTVMDEFWDAYPKMNNFEVRSHLAKFNFFDEDLFKSVGELSGGERARLELLKLMLSKSNFLLLDEPTNHLDIESKEVLENAIVDYSGTVLIISHDRYFLNKVVNKIWYLEDGKITEFYGNYDYFLEKLNEKNEAEEKIISKTEIEKEKKKKKEKEKEERAKKQKLKEIENKIFEIEEKIEICNKDIQNPEIFNDKDKFLQIGEDLSRLIKEKEKLYLEWENYL
ncbi:ABC-F family ATP-binding cassette domain-containing protein [Parvimonas micra]|uniref:ABC transporter, ATP-binding protein n=1 Tax=Parvimonas micra ATCC 33270 TaxID=411465 RepID=A8SMC5_9FIRM|nr:ABC-F family ATP-binding cassette domain-containing protein [Parvimonas micra]AXU10553.1 ABC transporter ATP-binding protein [Parvimonas micra]EDP23471.1 ABC transporter, ATP-binding protein [Parvimonas micra ATCC 33270]MEB3060909.1 ABC-F family ATP-binding cassette domain-containing protein [Parvimonas micra]MEB3066518.1 ABC-F family ATP-binding cassette domain-containing protein [Parvimonas micra]RSB90876.1 ABC transporter ATP-binding protein [Parvimonas micra]